MNHLFISSFLAEYLRKGTAYPPSGYNELDNMHMIPRSEHFRITPSPGAVTDRYGKILCFTRLF